MIVLNEAFFGSLDLIKRILFILVPLMAVIQIARDSRVIDILAKFLRPAMKSLTMREDAACPMLVGLVFGIFYGAGAIIEASEEGRLTVRDRYLLSIFLGICHSLFEDTMIFVAIGASAFTLISTRLIIGFVVTMVVARIWMFQQTGGYSYEKL